MPAGRNSTPVGSSEWSSWWTFWCWCFLLIRIINFSIILLLLLLGSFFFTCTTMYITMYIFCICFNLHRSWSCRNWVRINHVLLLLRRNLPLCLHNILLFDLQQTQHHGFSQLSLL